MFKLKNRIEIPLNFFDKLNALYPAQVRYLQFLQKHQANSTIKERIGILLSKPYLPDPIHSYNASIDYSKYSRKVKKIEQVVKNIIKHKISMWQSIINFVKRLFGK